LEGTTWGPGLLGSQPNKPNIRNFIKCILKVMVCSPDYYAFPYAMMLPASFLWRLIIYWYKKIVCFFMTLDGYPVGIMEKNFTQHFGKWNTQRRFSSSMFMFGESISYSFDNHRQSIYEVRLFVCFVCTYEIHWTGML